MDRERVLDVLKYGARVYFEGMMPRFSAWAEESVSEEYRDLATFYVAEINYRNSVGASSRRLWIDAEEQNEILQKYFKSREDS